MWTEIKARVKNEPVLVTSLAGAILSALAAFGFDLTQTQTVTLLACIPILMTVLFGRPNVTPSSKVVAFVDTSGTLQAGTGSGAKSAPGQALLSTPKATSSLQAPYVGRHRAS